MHEIGMLYQTAETADSYAKANGVEEVKTINIEIGELSGALPQVFTEYFPFVAEKYPTLKNASLELRRIPGEGMCADCKCMYNIMQREGICPRCGSRDKKILGGTDIRLVSIGY